LDILIQDEQQRYRQLNKTDVDTTESRQLTLEAAQESIVLLKNTNKALPLDINQLKNKRIALIGPTANATGLMQGNYHGIAPYLISPVEGFQNVTQGYSINVSYAAGCKINNTDQTVAQPGFLNQWANFACVRKRRWAKWARFL
jgi:beta-glucosidase-like glycosyl hydrolase